MTETFAWLTWTWDGMPGRYSAGHYVKSEQNMGYNQGTITALCGRSIDVSKVEVLHGNDGAGFCRKCERIDLKR